MPDTLPNIVIKLWSEKNWPMLIYYFRGRWNEDSWLYLKRNGNAVRRIKQEFTRLTGYQPYQPATNALHWDQEIAKYIERLGVAALIDDMRAAVEKYKPKSIIYFLHSTSACRWEMLLMDKIQEEIRQRKQYDDSAYAEMAKLFPASMVKKVEPEWVAKARKRRKELAEFLINWQTLPKEKITEIRGEIARINHNLENFGFAE